MKVSNEWKDKDKTWERKRNETRMKGSKKSKVKRNRQIGIEKR